jgi:hypothetical protein
MFYFLVSKRRVIGDERNARADFTHTQGVETDTRALGLEFVVVCAEHMPSYLRKEHAEVCVLK